MPLDILAADIGGTSSRFAHFKADDAGDLSCLDEIWLPTVEVSSFAELLSKVSSSPLGPLLQNAALFVIAAAGPVERGEICLPPNISWQIDLRMARANFRTGPCLLINDFLAQAYACVSDLGRHARSVLPGIKSEDGTIAVIGAGTGLGKAFLIPCGQGRYLGRASEGGHAGVGLESKEEWDFQRFVLDKIGDAYLTWDVVLSGRGLSLLAEFLLGQSLSAAEAARLFASEEQLLAWFARFYGRVCRDFALDLLASGGVYVSGGIAAKNPLILANRAFADAFHSSSTHGQFLQCIPLYLMEREDSGLWGAAYYGLRQLKESN